MPRTRQLLLVVAIFGASLTDAAGAAATIVATPADTIRHQEIEHLSTSPQVWVRDTPPDQGRYLRFISYFQSEESPQVFRVESWTYGDEGCCKRLVRAREFTLAQPMAQAFGPFNTRSCSSSFIFLGWQSLTSFRFSYLCRKFLAVGIHRDAFSVHQIR